MEFKKIKSLSYDKPQVLHAMLSKLADNIGLYANFQIECGAQVIQVFDSWAGNLSPLDYDTFAAPYQVPHRPSHSCRRANLTGWLLQAKVIAQIKASHPEVPVIIYINKSGALLERMARSGADIISLDWTVTVEEARARIGHQIGIQGNLDPMVLFAPDQVIKDRTEEILKAAGGRLGRPAMLDNTLYVGRAI